MSPTEPLVSQEPQQLCGAEPFFSVMLRSTVALSRRSCVARVAACVPVLADAKSVLAPQAAYVALLRTALGWFERRSPYMNPSQAQPLTVPIKLSPLLEVT